MTAANNKLCFVIGPIGKPRTDIRAHADTLLRKIIRPVFKTHFRDFVVQRADDIARPGMIDSQVITQMLEADLVIADLTGRNPNAYYELGIRHLFHKPIIHMMKDGEDLPFDVAPFRTIVFSYDTTPDITDAKKVLRKYIAGATMPDFKVENPVTRSAGYIALQQRWKEKHAAKTDSKPATSEPSSDAPYIADAPGLVWHKRRDDTWMALWQARSDLESRVPARDHSPLQRIGPDRTGQGVDPRDYDGRAERNATVG
jgi:hypothetical protein